MTDIILTGLPRSGTTLMCHLLNKIPNSVALHEPMRPADLAGLSPDATVAAVKQFFLAQRSSILKDGTARSKSSGGKVPSNPLGDRLVEGKRVTVLDGSEIKVSNVDREDFNLYVKQPAMFTALLPVLAESMECFATVRNPLSVLLSWRNANMPVTNGRAPAAEGVDPDLKQKLDGEPDVMGRQLLLLDYFFRRYADYLQGRVVKYEDVVATGGGALSLINPDAGMLDEPMSSRNARALAMDSDAGHVAARLLESDNACWWFYMREDVEQLLGAT